MQTALKYLTIVALAIAALAWPFVKVNSTEEEESEIGESSSARDAYRHLQLQDENGQVSPAALMEAYKQKGEMEFLPEAWGDLVQDIEPDAHVPWVSIGPGNIGGRVRSLVIHPTIPSTMWVGGVSGGIWKTTNGGGSWSTNTDFLTNLAVHCMAIDPANPNTLYFGTGEVIPGNGIFKTLNAGSSWTHT